MPTIAPSDKLNVEKAKALVTRIKGTQCYEHERDQGTLGSLTGCRHSRTPGRTYGFLIGKGGVAW
jgi:hypothetical protein